MKTIIAYSSWVAYSLREETRWSAESENVLLSSIHVCHPLYKFLGFNRYYRNDPVLK